MSRGWGFLTGFVKERWPWISAAALVLLIVVGIVSFSPTFRACYGQPPNQETSQADNEDSSIFNVTLLLCLGEFIEANSDPIIATFTVVLAFSTIGLWLQTARLAEGADEQAGKMAESIKQAARAATAMEGVSASMATNVATVTESVAISRSIADRQKLITELQSRAYLAVDFLGMVPQDHTTGLRFEPRMRVTNVGSTPAYKVRYRVAADVLPFPMRVDFTFPLGEETMGASISLIGPHQHKILSAVVPKIYPPVEESQIKVGIGQRIVMWGHFTYDDAFGIERDLKFAQTFFWLSDGQTVMSQDTKHHNDGN